MRRRLLLGTLLASSAGPALAQAPERVRRIGVMIDGSPPHPLPDALRAGMKERGWADSAITFEVRYADGQPARSAEQATELAGARVDAIVAHFTPSVRAAMAATISIPVIMAPAGAPVETGLVQTLSRPGGNVTGVTNMAAELGGRRLQLLKDMIPSLGRVAALVSTHDAFTRPFIGYLQDAANSGGLQLDPVAVGGPAEFEAAFTGITERRAGALVIQGVFNSQRAQVVALANRHRLPTMWFDRRAVDEGGLVSLSANSADMYRRACGLLDKVLRGAKPGELPVEQPSVFELVLNLKTAQVLGLTVPRSVLVQADELVE
jgi:putative ABC transport system substrate-binding protein